MHVPTSFYRREIRLVVLTDEKRQSVFLCFSERFFEYVTKRILFLSYKTCEENMTVRMTAYLLQTRLEPNVSTSSGTKTDNHGTS